MSIQAELYRVFKSWKSRFFILLVFLIPMIDLLFVIHQNIVPQWPVEWSYRRIALYHPCMASFLSAAAHGHIMQMLLIWLMPIYILLIYGDSYIQEKTVGYTAIIYSHYSRKKVLYTRFAVSFLLFFGAFFLSMLLNFILANIIFINGGSMKGLEQLAYDDVLPAWLAWSLRNPYLSYLLCMAAYSLIAGAGGILCYAVCLLFPSYKLAYPICFFLWFLQIASRYSITYAIQPYIEYGPEKFLIALLRYFAIALIIILICRWREVKCDKI